jgi:hypothetical protein
LGRRRAIRNPLDEAKAAEQRHADSFHHGGRGPSAGQVREAAAELARPEGHAPVNKAPLMSAADLSALTA